MAVQSVGPFVAPAIFVVLDGRSSPAWTGAPSDTFRLWVGAAQEAVALQAEVFSSLSIVAVYDGYYESCLSFSFHTPSDLQRTLAGLEQKWVLGPAGLGGSGWASNDIFGDSRGGMLPEHAASVPNGFLLPERSLPNSKGAKRARKAAVASPNRGERTRRLFAVGEDTALAALRSALTQLAKLTGNETRKRLEYWTSEADLLLPVIEDLCIHIPEEIEVVVLLIATSAATSYMQNIAKAQILESKFHNCGLPKSSLLRVEALAPSAASFACQVRAPLDVVIPLRIRLPVRIAHKSRNSVDAESSNQDVLLLGTPSVLLTPKQRKNMLSLLAGATALTCTPGVAVDFEFVCRTAAGNVSGELLYGIPLIMRSAPGAFGVTCRMGATYQSLLRNMLKRDEALVLSANMCPLRLAPTRTQFFFVAFPTLPDDGGRLILRGVAFADNWQPDTLLQDSCGGSLVSEDAVSRFELPMHELSQFDPFKLRGDRAGDDGLRGRLIR